MLSEPVAFCLCFRVHLPDIFQSGQPRLTGFFHIDTIFGYYIGRKPGHWLWEKGRKKRGLSASAASGQNQMLLLLARKDLQIQFAVGLYAGISIPFIFFYPFLSFLCQSASTTGFATDSPACEWKSECMLGIFIIRSAFE